MVIPLHGGPIGSTKKLRKSLRDVRDRAAQQDHRWRAVAMAGLEDGHQALILVQHPDLRRVSLWSMLKRRWPNVLLTDPGSTEPTSTMTVEAAVALARRRRGVEPIRIVVLPQVAAATVSQGRRDEPMPMLF